MASSAFKSTTKRSPIGAEDSGSSNRTTAHRRSRSLSRAPVRLRPSDVNDDFEKEELPRAKFVNTVRGSGFPEINHSNDFFSPSDESQRSARRSSSFSAATIASSQRRGRSVSRHGGRVADAGSVSKSGIFENTSSGKGGKGSLDSNLRRRRSVSVARYQFSDSSESDDIDHSHKPSHHANVKGSDHWNHQGPTLHKPLPSNQQRTLRRSLSQKDFLKSRDDYSSHSSTLTDEEARETQSSKNGAERTIRAVYSQKKSEHPTVDGGDPELYEVMRKELRHAVEEIRTELGHGIAKINHSVLVNDDCLLPHKSGTLQDVALIRDNYAAKLEQSEKRKQDLLSEMLAEEQRGRELSKIVKELLPDQRNTAPQKNPSRGRKKNDRNWMSKCLTQDAEKYFDDFISNIEDTDISSFDGERSDASSTVGVKKQRDPIIHSEETETCEPPMRSNSASVEMDGVVLPWLQWETSNDGSPISHKSKAESASTQQNKSHNLSKEESTTQIGSNLLGSSRGSWSPGVDSPSVFCRNDMENKFGVQGSNLSQSSSTRPRDVYLDMDDYFHIQQSEEVLFEGWKQRHRISSGALVLCSTTCL